MNSVTNIQLVHNYRLVFVLCSSPTDKEGSKFELNLKWNLKWHEITLQYLVQGHLLCRVCVNQHFAICSTGVIRAVYHGPEQDWTWIRHLHWLFYTIFHIICKEITAAGILKTCTQTALQKKIIWRKHDFCRKGCPVLEYWNVNI